MSGKMADPLHKWMGIACAVLKPTRKAPYCMILFKKCFLKRAMFGGVGRSDFARGWRWGALKDKGTGGNWEGAEILLYLEFGGGHPSL